MRIRLKPTYLAIIIVVIMFGGIAVSDKLDYWVTESSKVPAKYTSGEFEGSYNPADIRGSYSFEDISTSFEIPLEHLAAAFELSNGINVKEYQCKNLELDYEAAAKKGFEIGTDSVRIFVALYKGLSIELMDTYIPESAYRVLRENASLTKEQTDYLDKHTVDMSSLEAVQPAEEPVPTIIDVPASIGSEAVEGASKSNDSEAVNDTTISKSAAPRNAQKNQESSSITTEQQSSGGNQVKGKTTFKELLDWGVTKEEIEQLIGKEMPDVTLSVRDFCGQQGIEFSTIKEGLQNIADKK